ncbi:MAG: hypothetical protein RMK18_08430 [Armatimonadota bacterium]|nr:hypothetical protein [Armatimonadota bacterium]MCX7777717.1 hypothetical protein [Armatimonadota bacterium]MDW8025868.1 hypothetical protein [Armatimonadota bacterium]
MNGQLPKVQIGGYEVTKLIIGGNPFRGFSHISAELNREMLEYYTDERIIEALLEAQRCGINTFIARGDEHIMRVVRKLRNLGGTLQWIAQTAPEIKDWRKNIRDILEHNPIAIYFHGGRTDELFCAGMIGELIDAISFIHDAGLPAGIATHMHEVIEFAEEHGLKADFYMACFYNPRRPPGEVYLPQDRERMCQTIRKTSKPCIAFKVLAAGRHCDTEENLRSALKYAIENIKPCDAIVVGVFQKYKNQIAEDVEIVKQLLCGCSS